MISERRSYAWEGTLAISASGGKSKIFLLILFLLQYLKTDEYGTEKREVLLQLEDTPITTAGKNELGRFMQALNNNEIDFENAITFTPIRKNGKE